jgi:hypothetical protein
MRSKIPHVVHLTNQHWMNQSFHCRHGSILQELKKIKFIGFFFGVLIAVHMTRNKCLG